MPRKRRSILARPIKSRKNSKVWREWAKARVSGHPRANDDDVSLSVLATVTRNDTSINSVQNLQSGGSEYDSSLSDSVSSKDSRTNIRRVNDEADQESLDMNSHYIAPPSYLAAANNSVSTVMSFETPPTRLPAACSSVESAPLSHVSSLKDCTPPIESDCTIVEEDSSKEFLSHITLTELVKQFNKKIASYNKTSPESETNLYRIHNSAQGLFIDTDLILPYMDWVVKHETNGDIRLIKLGETMETLLCKVVITVSKTEPYLNIIVHQKDIPRPTHDIYSKYGGKPLSNKEIGKMVEEINCYGICIGNPDPEFKTSYPKNGLAYIESDFGDHFYHSTIRSAKCHLLFNAGPRCPNCCSLRNTLKATASRKRQRTDNLEDPSIPLTPMSQVQLQDRLRTISSENKCLKIRNCHLSMALASVEPSASTSAKWEGNNSIKETSMKGIQDSTTVIPSAAQVDNIKQEHFETDIKNSSDPEEGFLNPIEEDSGELCSLLKGIQDSTTVIPSATQVDNIKQEHFETDIKNSSDPEEGFLNPIEEDSGELCSLLNNTEHIVKEESLNDMSVENTNMLVASELNLVCCDDQLDQDCRDVR